jgi:pectin methylesterase-like acyl-CoA thioesterase
VALDGSGDYVKIQDAIDAVPDNSTIPTVIFIKRGTYDTEKLLVPANKTNVILIGESRDETIISYHIYDCPTGGINGKCPAADAQLWPGGLLQTSATLTIEADDFLAENLTIQNTAGPVGQALAITVRSDRVVFRNCDLLGYQDTIYLWSSAKRAYFENCLVLGRTDYIYGSGTAFFESCEIRSWGGGWITAPSTAQTQPYGFVFNQCDLTYAINSPRAGDDGALVRLGRPWHNYPKVAWLYCSMTEKIHPEGWADIWNMPYAPTSPDLHLYEYMNTGPGADTSGRANWVGLRGLSAAEAANYTVQNVLGGTDNWDPSALGTLVPTFTWTGAGATSDWLLADNWNPVAVPDTSEAAYISGMDTIIANGGHFVADLSVLDSAMLIIAAPSEVTYLAVGKGTIKTDVNTALQGRIRTKDSILIDVTNTFDLSTEVIGVHRIGKVGSGDLQLNADNTNFTGYWAITSGGLIAAVANSLGKARSLTVSAGAMLTVDTGNAIDTQTPLRIEAGGSITLNDDITLLECYFDGVLQPVGTYSATTHPGIISGPGVINVGRPTSFTFIGGGNGNWDNPAHFQPALLPQAGDTVYSSIEMETTSFLFPADIYVQAGGRMRLRGTHSASGTIYMETGANFAYATSGPGFTLDAPTVILGDVSFALNSLATPSHAMRLGGPISGEGQVSVRNQRDGVDNTGIVVLSGDNTGFTGTWDLTVASVSANGVTAIQANGEGALGRSTVEVGANNLLILSHVKGASDTLRVNLYEDARIQLDTEVAVEQALIGGVSLAQGIYDVGTNPEYFVGEGALYVGVPVTSIAAPRASIQLHLADRQLHIEGHRLAVTVYDLGGRAVKTSSANTTSLVGLPAGMYVVRYEVDGQEGIQKIALR